MKRSLDANLAYHSTLLIEEHPSAAVIATFAADTPFTNSFLVLATGLGDKAIFYYGTDDWQCQFHSFNEVGEPFQSWYKHELRRRGLRVVWDNEACHDIIVTDLLKHDTLLNQYKQARQW